MGVFHPEIMWTARMPWVQWQHGALFSLGNDSHWDQSVMFAVMHVSQAAWTCMMTALRRPAWIGSKLLGLPCRIFREMNTLAGLEQADVSGNETKCLFFFLRSAQRYFFVYTHEHRYICGCSCCRFRILTMGKKNVATGTAVMEAWLPLLTLFRTELFLMIPEMWF